MKRETRERVARLLFLLEERALRTTPQCACRRPIAPLLTPELREAIDKLVAAIAEEPELGIGAYIEVD